MSYLTSGEYSVHLELLCIMIVVIRQCCNPRACSSCRFSRAATVILSGLLVWLMVAGPLFRSLPYNYPTLFVYIKRIANN